MASITIRKLDEATKVALRLRAAANGRSVEDEVRVLLRGAAKGETPSSKSENAPVTATVTLIIGGGIAAYKSLDLIRRLKERGCAVRCVLTAAAQKFVTPLAASALSHGRIFTDLFDATTEFDVGHIRLARDCDLVLIAPATADLIAKMANGHGDDLATAILLATNRPVLLAPAMNPAMWAASATTRNVAALRADGIHFIGPMAGEMAERGEAGVGRMAEPTDIAEAALRLLRTAPKSLAGKRVIVTAGPTHEPIDPVRYIANRSSGKQGYAIAVAARDAGADVTLVTGPVDLPPPNGIQLVRVQSAREMLASVQDALPADIAIFAAAVADWRVADEGRQKLKKSGGAIPPLTLVENPDILATIAQRSEGRPSLVIGFAAETENILDHATAKLARKRCDWIVANDVSPASGVMGGDRNTVHVLLRENDTVVVDSWPSMSKNDVARTLVTKIAQAVAPQ